MKITKFYIDRAIYKAMNDSGQEVRVEIDYWNNQFNISVPNKKLESVARDMLRRKHKVNFADKLLK